VPFGRLDLAIGYSRRVVTHAKQPLLSSFHKQNSQSCLIQRTPPDAHFYLSLMSYVINTPLILHYKYTPMSPDLVALNHMLLPAPLPRTNLFFAHQKYFHLHLNLRFSQPIPVAHLALPGTVTMIPKTKSAA
jgi:hypothetical protein